MLDLLVRLIRDEVERREVEETQGDRAVDSVDDALGGEVVVGSRVPCVAKGLLESCGREGLGKECAREGGGTRRRTSSRQAIGWRTSAADQRITII